MRLKRAKLGIHNCSYNYIFCPELLVFIFVHHVLSCFSQSQSNQSISKMFRLRCSVSAPNYTESWEAIGQVYILCSKPDRYTLTYINIALHKARLCYANIKDMTGNLVPWTLVAPYEGWRKDCCIYVLFSCYAVCIFIGKKQQNLGVGEGVERDKSRGAGGPNSSGK